jgi:hypothetical protein
MNKNQGRRITNPALICRQRLTAFQSLDPALDLSQIVIIAIVLMLPA